MQYVKGVGPARAAQLKRLGLETVEDVLWAAPRRYEDRSRLRRITDLTPGTAATVRARVVRVALRRTQRGRSLVEAVMGDETGTISCLWFHQPYLIQQVKPDAEFIVYGRLEPGPPARRARAGRRLQFIHPELERVGGGEHDAQEAALHTGRIVPIYPLTEGVGQRWYRRVVHTVVSRYASTVAEALPADLRDRLALKPVAWALQQMHFPESWEALDAARRRLVFDELFLIQIRLALRRSRLTARRKPQRYQASGPLTEALFRRLPFALTASQRRVFEELCRDLCETRPMLRLLQGDVGSGKTVVAAALMAVAVQSGYQVALMAPTELLAEQHARVLRGYFEPLGVRVGLLAQGVAPADRKRLIRGAADGTVQMLVGTHALIESAVTFKQLALVVIDEQHKFGVAQRSRLVRKAGTPDVLVMTATPIPRTLALSLYGDLACSTLTELPPGRVPIRTLWYPESSRPEVYRQIREELAAGRQGYVVYPLVDVSDRQALRAATQMAATLKTQVFPEFRVELLHGQMRPRAKESIMGAFVEGRVQLLVSTVIVEVGLDVPNAAVMLIEHPERFGLAQLHQLRGRIGRGTHPATCFALSDTTDETAQKRLAAFAETADGFQLAEQDLELRGPGELLGRRQSGFLRFRMADLTRDQALLDLARQEAFDLVEREPQLGRPDLAPLRERLKRAGLSS